MVRFKRSQIEIRIKKHENRLQQRPAAVWTKENDGISVYDDTCAEETFGYGHEKRFLERQPKGIDGDDSVMAAKDRGVVAM